MREREDGGSVFPLLDHNGHTLVCREFGMTLRDWLAGQAGEADIEIHMKGEVISSSPYAYGEKIIVDKYTREEAKYRYADAMLEARK